MLKLRVSFKGGPLSRAGFFQGFTVNAITEPPFILAQCASSYFAEEVWPVILGWYVKGVQKNSRDAKRACRR